VKLILSYNQYLSGSVKESLDPFIKSSREFKIGDSVKVKDKIGKISSIHGSTYLVLIDSKNRKFKESELEKVLPKKGKKKTARVFESIDVPSSYLEMFKTHLINPTDSNLQFKDVIDPKTNSLKYYSYFLKTERAFSLSLLSYVRKLGIKGPLTLTFVSGKIKKRVSIKSNFPNDEITIGGVNIKISISGGNLVFTSGSRTKEFKINAKSVFYTGPISIIQIMKAQDGEITMIDSDNKSFDGSETDIKKLVDDFTLNKNVLVTSTRGVTLTLTQLA
jgi:hypothetical protein